MSSSEDLGYGSEFRLFLSSPDSNYPNLSAETAHFLSVKHCSFKFRECKVVHMHESRLQSPRADTLNNKCSVMSLELPERDRRHVTNNYHARKRLQVPQERSTYGKIYQYFAEDFG